MNGNTNILYKIMNIREELRAIHTNAYLERIIGGFFAPRANKYIILDSPDTKKILGIGNTVNSAYANALYNINREKQQKSKSVWVVTRAINQYNQDGEYLVCVFVRKPSFKELRKILPDETNETIGRLTRGGGRKKTENEWFMLTEIESGEVYKN